MKRLLRIFLIIMPLAILLCSFLYLNKKVENSADRLCINEIMTKGILGQRDVAGMTADWVELYNGSDVAMDLSGYGLSNASGSPYKFTFSNTVLNPGDYLLIYCSSYDIAGDCINAGFFLNAEDDELYLTDDKGDIVDSISYQSMGYDISYGRSYNNSDNLVHFSIPTPGTPNKITIENDNDSIDEVVDISLIGNAITMSVDCADATILYTMDGSEPDIYSQIYTEPIDISDCDGAVPFRARVYEDNELGDISTYTYKPCENEYYLEEVYLTVDPYDMFGNEKGIYVSGAWGNLIKARGKYQPFIGNYLAYGDIDGYVEIPSENYATNTKVSLKGSGSRSQCIQKTFALEMDDSYKIDDMFCGTVVLRATGDGDDYRDCKVEAYVEDIVSELDLSATSGHYVNLFINGEYWGIYRIQEELDKSFFSNHYDVDTSGLQAVTYDTDIIHYWDHWEDGYKLDVSPIVGIKYGGEDASIAYEELFQEILVHNYDNPDDMEWLENHIDIDNFTDYMIVELFFQNCDWSTHNVMLWRTGDVDENNVYADGRWRWAFYDGDMCLHNPNIASESFIEFTTNREVQEADSIYLTLILFDKLWETDEFRDRFRERLAELSTTVLDEDNLLEKYDVHYESLLYDIEKNLQKKSEGYDQTNHSETEPKTMDQWIEDMEIIRTIIVDRCEYVRSYGEL